jgi:hypothetical protein
MIIMLIIYHFRFIIIGLILMSGYSVYSYTKSHTHTQKQYIKYML